MVTPLTWRAAQIVLVLAGRVRRLVITGIAEVFVLPVSLRAEPALTRGHWRAVSSMTTVFAGEEV